MKPRFIHKYAPKQVFTMASGYMPVASYVTYPPGKHPAGCPLVKDCWAVEFRMGLPGSRWQGCRYAYINSQLRMVLVFDAPLRDEVIRKLWRTVPVKFRAPLPPEVES